MTKYSNPHEAAMLIRPLVIRSDNPNLYPAIYIAKAGEYTYSDGSGGQRDQYWSVNQTACPYALRERRHLEQTVQSVSLMCGLYAKAPELYQAMHELLQHLPAPVGTDAARARDRAVQVMRDAVNQDWKH